MLSRLAKSNELELIVAHVNHGLRAESAEEAQFVQGLAQLYGAAFQLCVPEKWDEKENVESWGRRVRYEFFEHLRSEAKGDLVVTAHHQNDQAETLAFRLLTGRILTSAKSILEFDPHQMLLRPLLRIPKESIVEYVSLYSLPYVSDVSNYDLARGRNRIRHHLLPILKGEYNPNIVEDLAMTAERLFQDEEYLREQARAWADRAVLPITPRFLLEEVPLPLQWRVLAEKAVDVFGVDAGRIGYPAFQSVLRLMQKKHLDGPKVLELGFGYSARIHPVKGVGFEVIR